MKHLLVSMSVKQNLFVSVFVHKCFMMLNDVEYTTFKMFANHANEQLSLCYFFSINVSENIALPLSQALKPRPNGQTLFGKHWKFCLSSTMFVGLATTQTGA